MEIEARTLAEEHYDVPGTLVEVQPFASGHIHASYKLTCVSPAGRACFLLQRVNEQVFPDVHALMDNVARVSRHIAAKLRAAGTPDLRRRSLSLVLTRTGDACCRDAAGVHWRLYEYIDNTITYESVTHAWQAEQAACAFGRFQALLADLPPPRLHETIAGFHDTPQRLRALDEAVRCAARHRVASVHAELDAIEAMRGLAEGLARAARDGALPERIVHNDAKITNVLFDAVTAEALCVVDLDTVMPGVALYDFGDMMRSMLCDAAEDEADLARVDVRLALFEGLVRGYLTGTNRLLTAAEREQLVTAGEVITFEQAVRFLTDYLHGDTYYRTTRPGQNLDRTRVQLKLLQSMLRHDGLLRDTARAVARALPRAAGKEK